MFFSGAVEVLPDKQGRFIIPQYLKDFAGIKKDAALEMVGIWFQTNPDTNPIGYGVYVENDSILFCSQLLFDDHNVTLIPLIVANGSQIVPALADKDIAGHISIIGGKGAGLIMNYGTQIQSGDGSEAIFILCKLRVSLGSLNHQVPLRYLLLYKQIAENSGWRLAASFL